MGCLIYGLVSVIQSHKTKRTIVFRRKKVPWFDKEVQRAMVKKNR